MSQPSRLLTLPVALTTFVLAISSSAFAADSPPAPQTYTVNLSPTHKVGEKVGIIDNNSTKQQTQATITMPGTPAPQVQNQNQDTVAHFEADGEVLAVFPNGGVQKAALTVKAITITINGQPMPGLPAVGTKIVAEKVGKTKNITIDGKPASADLAKALDQVIPLDDEKHTNQDIFGPKAPVAVGATWPINSAAIIDMLKDDLGDISSVNGQIKLDAINGAGSDQIATVSGAFTLDGVKPPLPPGVTVDSIACTAKMSGTVPATTKGKDKEMMGLSMKMEAHGESGGVTIKLSISLEQENSGEITYQ